MKKSTQEQILNDYELLYMATDDTPEAIEILVKKYKPLVYTRIKKFRIIPSQIDDFYQESLITLMKAIDIYDEKSRMSFTNFYDLLLQRRFIDILRKNKRYYENNILSDNIDVVVAYTPNAEEKININEKLVDQLSELETHIYALKTVEHLKAKEIAQKLNIPIKQVYSATDRIKLKYHRLTVKKE